jgi:hypothetical protein
MVPDDSMDLYKVTDSADKVMEVATPTVVALHADASEVKQLREVVARLQGFS